MKINPSSISQCVGATLPVQIKGLFGWKVAQSKLAPQSLPHPKQSGSLNGTFITLKEIVSWLFLCCRFMVSTVLVPRLSSLFWSWTVCKQSSAHQNRYCSMENPCPAAWLMLASEDLPNESCKCSVDRGVHRTHRNKEHDWNLDWVANATGLLGMNPWVCEVPWEVLCPFFYLGNWVFHNKELKW